MSKVRKLRSLQKLSIQKSESFGWEIEEMLQMFQFYTSTIVSNFKFAKFEDVPLQNCGAFLQILKVWKVGNLKI